MPRPAQLCPFMDAHLPRTMADTTTEAYTRLASQARSNPLVARGIVPGPRMGSPLASVIKALVYSHSSQDPTVPIQQILEETATLLNHIGYNRGSPTQRCSMGTTRPEA